VEAARQAVVCPYCKVTNTPVREPERVVVEVAVPVAVGSANAQAMEGATSIVCPRCTAVLFAAETGGVTLNGCGRCGGIWLDNEACQAVVRSYDPAVVALARRAASHATARPRATEIACPVCNARLQRAQAGGIVLDVCADHGTWFDRAELELVMGAQRIATTNRGLARAAEDADALRGTGEYARGAQLVGGVALGVLGALLSAKS
jgi:Zn-finger nucleic acid-binding protein